MAFAWARMAAIALDKDDAFYKAKLATARFFMQRILPESSSLAAKVLAGGESLRAFEDAAF
jgi:hypothetical protein